MSCPIFDVGGTLSKIAISGGTALALLFAYKSKFPSSLFSWHPTLLGFGWLAMTPYAIKLLRESKKETKKEAKVEKVKLHAYINAAVMAFSLGGLFAIYRNKEIVAASKNQVAKHLVSLHAKVGVLSAVLAALAMSTSIYKTYFTTSDGAATYTWRNNVHRQLGILSYAVAGLAILLIVNGPWGKFHLGGAGSMLVSSLLAGVQFVVVSSYLWG